jgi:hypothetical protein
MINFLPSEIIAHIGTFIKSTDDRKNAYLAGKNFSHLLYHNVGHIIPMRPNKDNQHYERLAYVLKKRKPNLHTITFTFDSLPEDAIEDIPGKIDVFRQAFPRAQLQAYIARCEQPDAHNTLCNYIVHNPYRHRQAGQEAIQDIQHQWGWEPGCMPEFKRFDGPSGNPHSIK